MSRLRFIKKQSSSAFFSEKISRSFIYTPLNNSQLKFQKIHFKIIGYHHNLKKFSKMNNSNSSDKDIRGTFFLNKQNYDCINITRAGQGILIACSSSDAASFSSTHFSAFFNDRLKMPQKRMIPIFIPKYFFYNNLHFTIAV